MIKERRLRIYKGGSFGSATLLSYVVFPIHAGPLSSGGHNTSLFFRIPTTVNPDELTSNKDCCEYMEDFENSIGAIFLGSGLVIVCLTLCCIQGVGDGRKEKKSTTQINKKLTLICSKLVLDILTRTGERRAGSKLR